MQIPFTTEQFLDIFKRYNEAVFPAQIILNLIAIIALYFVFVPFARAGKLISAALGLLWLWMGVAYHLLFFSAINKAAYAFAAFFVVQGLLFFGMGVFKNTLTFRFGSNGYGITGFIFILYALIIYPLLGLATGHAYPYSPTFGLPCPTAIFTFGMLLLCDKKCPVILLIIPLLWSFVGFSAVVSFGVWEDTGLLVAGLVSFILILIRNRKLAKDNVVPAVNF
jgi:hypothetical protein